MGSELAFRKLAGVTTTAAGFTGGNSENAPCREVYSSTTGHAEAVQIQHDPAHISHETLLDVFWRIHDPAQIGSHGSDIGTQYQSAMFFRDPDQERTARTSRDALVASARYRRPIATEISSAVPFWRAEECLQQNPEKRSLATRHPAPARAWPPVAPIGRGRRCCRRPWPAATTRTPNSR